MWKTHQQHEDGCQAQEESFILIPLPLTLQLFVCLPPCLHEQINERHRYHLRRWNGACSLLTLNN